MSVTPIIVVAIYFMVVLWLGWRARDQASQSVEDYWVAGGRTPFWLNFPAVIAVYISGGSFLGMAGLAYRSGTFTPTMFILGALLGIGLSVVLTGAQFRRAGAVSFADYMGKIFADHRVRGVAAFIFGFYALGYVVPQFQGGAVAFSSLLGLNHAWAVVAIGVIVVLYTAMGGFWAVTWSDALQGTLLFVAMLGLGVVALVKTGGPINLWNSVLANNPGLASSEGQLLGGVGLLITWAFAWASFPAVVSRVFGSQDEIVATRSLALGGLAYAVFHTVTIYVIGPAALLVAPGLDNPDFALLAVMEAYLPSLLVGIVAAGLLGALMSSADSLLMGATSALVHDIYVGLLRPNTDHATEVRLSRGAVVALGALAVLFAIRTPAIIGEVAAIVAGYAASSLFFPMVLGTWWRRTTSQGAMAGMLVGAAVYIAAFYLTDLPAFSQVLYGVMASLVTVVVVSLVASRPISSERAAMLDRVQALYRVSDRSTLATPDTASGGGN